MPATKSSTSARNRPPLSRRSTPNSQLPTPNSQPPTPNPKPPNPKPQTPNPKPQTPNPKPQTPDPPLKVKVSEGKRHRAPGVAAGGFPRFPFLSPSGLWRSGFVWFGGPSRGGPCSGGSEG